jgi:hypothetical protein
MYLRSLFAFIWVVATLREALAPSYAAAPDAHIWKTYFNERFAYSVCYPSDLLTPGPEAADGDGRNFVGDLKVELIVYGSNWDGTLTDSINLDLAHLSGTVTYKVIKTDWYVLSGQNMGYVFYTKTVHVNGQFKSVRLTYPEAQATTWNSITARISACFEGSTTTRHSR